MSQTGLLSDLPDGLRRTLRRGLARLPGRRAGYVDRFDETRVAGWAADPARPEGGARLSLHVDGVAVMNIVANLPREDVSSRGLAPLHCGFDAALPARLRDGRSHRVELRLGESGPVLRGGRLSIAARPGAAAARIETGLVEGLAWFDRPRGAVVGWAAGTTALTGRWDDGPAETVMLDREVPGFGKGVQQGFVVPVPPALCDGQVHRLRLEAGGTEIDGSPVEVIRSGNRPAVSLVSAVGGQVVLGLSDATGAAVSRPVAAFADGRAVTVRAKAGPGETGRITLDLPAGTAELVLRAGSQEGPQDGTQEADGAILARYLVQADHRAAPAGLDLTELSPRLSDPRLDLADLPEDLARAARQAFEAAGRALEGGAEVAGIDPDWLARETGLTGSEAVAHWHAEGAARGLSPGPGFEEAAARRRHPGLARAVEEGRIPCAFAVELALGPGALASTEPEDGPGIGPAPGPWDEGAEARPGPASLPPPSRDLAPQDSIWAASLARLTATRAERGEIDEDERLMRAEIAATPLRERPLVSIVMPTWNRAFTIGEAIQSVIEQSYGNWELLICDDASEDRTADVVRGFDDPRIRYMTFLKSNGAGARNHGLRFARGEYIAYLDSDNIWHPLFLDRMLRALEERPACPIAYAAYLDTQTVGAAIRLEALARPTFRPIALSSKNFMDLNGIVHHRRVSNWLGGFDPALARLQDWDLVLRHTSIFGATYVDRIGVFYRRNIAWGQVTHTQLGSGAQDSVGEKTRDRLAGNHARLALDWPVRPRLTLLRTGAPGAGAAALDAALADGLAGLAAPTADLLRLALDSAGAEDEGGSAPGPETRLPPELASDPARLMHLLDGALAEGPVIAVGPLPQGLEQSLRQGPASPGHRLLHLRNLGEQTALVSVGEARIDFPLGAVPIDLPSAAASGPTGSASGSGDILVLRTEAAPANWAALAEGPALQDLARVLGTGLLLPPSGRAPWLRLDGRRADDLGPALPAALAGIRATMVLGPLGGLDPAGMALLQALQARGVPALVAADTWTETPDGLARQWIEARATFALRHAEPAWIDEKVGTLLQDHGAMARLDERSRIVHAIAFHPALARERLAHAIWRLTMDPPRPGSLRRTG
ncbi:glycosyltransferase family 2 protein [Wenxinia marina]|uniref:Glycosyltransferase 2-like domain-containing protein n=1 Tax=Wenxinia marina DSM 24838 TaxID=1123501 RepID=A0A0D0QAA0_9RHOB|nr:glycosyltransferase [Wenxinia marina]KIQ71399.1 hypothetical protein Wenmar_04109 [Wenxinia marina DSM 24838]